MTIKMSCLAASIGVLVSSAGCATVQGSAVAVDGTPETPSNGPVQLVMLGIPPGARAVGIIQARGHVAIDELAPEFVAQAASLGADIAKVDTISTKFEMVSQTESYSYACGKSTCSGSRTVEREVATTQMLGRAFRRRSP